MICQRCGLEFVRLCRAWREGSTTQVEGIPFQRQVIDHEQGKRIGPVWCIDCCLGVPHGVAVSGALGTFDTDELQPLPAWSPDTPEPVPTQREIDECRREQEHVYILPGSHGSSGKSKRYGGPKQGGKTIEREGWE